MSSDDSDPPFDREIERRELGEPPPPPEGSAAEDEGQSFAWRALELLATGAVIGAVGVLWAAWRGRDEVLDNFFFLLILWPATFVLWRRVRLRSDEREGAGLPVDPFARERGPRRWPVWLVLFASGAVFVFAFVVSRGESDVELIRRANEAERAGEETGTALELAVVDVSQLRIGDCVGTELFGDERVREARVVPCSSEWRYMLIDMVELRREGAYPGLVYFEEQQLKCDDWSTGFLYPEQDLWESSDRRVFCLVESDVLFTPSVGSCYLTSVDDVLASGSEVPCERRHLIEAYFITEHSGAEFPGVSAIETFGDQACESEFEDYVGLPYDESEVFAFHRSPSRVAWELMGVREVDCFLYVLGGEVGNLAPVTGSFRGAAR